MTTIVLDNHVIKIDKDVNVPRVLRVPSLNKNVAFFLSFHVQYRVMRDRDIFRVNILILTSYKEEATYWKSGFGARFS